MVTHKLGWEKRSFYFNLIGPCKLTKDVVHKPKPIRNIAFKDSNNSLLYGKEAADFAAKTFEKEYKKKEINGEAMQEALKIVPPLSDMAFSILKADIEEEQIKSGLKNGPQLRTWSLGNHFHLLQAQCLLSRSPHHKIGY